MLGAREPESKTEQLIRAGKQALKKGNGAEAAEYFKRALREAPLRHDVRQLLAAALDDSIEVPPTLGKAGKSRPFEGLRVREAFQVVSNGAPSASVPSASALSRLERSRPPIGMISLALGFILLVGASGAFVWLRQSGMTLFPLASAPEESPEEKALREAISQAEYHRTQGQYGEGIALLENMLQGEVPDEAPVKKKLAQIYLAQGETDYQKSKYTSAIKSYRKAVEYNGSAADYHYQLGWAYYMEGRSKSADRKSEARESYKKAQEALRQAIQLEGNNVQYYNAMAHVQIALNNTSEAAKMFYKIIELSPDSLEAKRAKQKLQTMGLRV
ncbi:MAG: tetratricopeptide repeat protein [bacterium]